MKTLSYIFNVKKLCAIGAICAMLTPALAATGNNGCDNDDNDRINPEIALCSTHVYNIGQTQNPASETDKQLMRDVVALKTTVMTQQMYKQYEYLDATLKRFKTQLEKAVLTTKLAVAGADTSAAGSSSYSSFRVTDSNIRLAGAQNCMTTTLIQNAYSCLSSNVQLVLNAVNGGNSVGEAKKQLEADLKVAESWTIIYRVDKQYSTSASTSSGFTHCNSLKSTRDSVIGCAQELNVAIARALDERQQRQNMYNRTNNQPN